MESPDCELDTAVEDVEGADSVSRTESDGGRGWAKGKFALSGDEFDFLITGGILDFSSSISLSVSLSAREKSWKRC